MAHDLVSLITVLEQDRVLDDHKKALVESLLQKATSLKNLLEKSVTEQHRGNKEMIRELQSEIRDAAHEAEDMIESHVVDHMLSEPEATMIEVMEKFDAANDRLTDIVNNYYQGSSHDEAQRTMDVNIDPTSSKTNTFMMVGFEEDVLQLKHRLTSQRSGREIIPIVGMGGTGKTTLARNIYNDPLIVSHFAIRAWVTVSQHYDVRDILSSLIGCITGKVSDNMPSEVLGDNLYRRLYGQRYLLVLDDIWNEQAWDEIQRYFPKEGNGSRILITSRELHVAKHPDPDCEEHQMHLLSDAQGWDLLRRKVFGNEQHCCPHSLEEIGQKIASSCGGLPLAISVIGGLLSVDKYSKDLWDQVSRDVPSITDNHISEILCLSYDNLPLHLRPCFLYMSAFPEDYKVRHSKLVKLLVAEGFMSRSNGQKNKSLEDVAEEYLKALVDRNLLSVATTKYNGRAESYSMHDLLRDLCVRKAEEEKFLRIFKPKYANSFRRVSIHHYFTEDVPHLAEELSCSRSLLLINPRRHLTNLSSILSTFRLVRVLDVYDIYIFDFPIAILKLANLRFLAVSFCGSLPSAIWRLRNLQTLLVRIMSPEGLILPCEAWEISCLRHIMVKGSSIDIDLTISRVQEYLQTIRCVNLHDLFASNLINNIPNIKELGIHGFVSEGRIIDLSHLHKLETLRLEWFGFAALSLVKLPNCLKKLSLYYCTLPMELVNGVGGWQYLQVLKIEHCTFQSEEHDEEEEEENDDDEHDDSEEEEEEEDLEEDTEEEEEWELNEGVEFSSLQFLSLQYSKIKRWKADYSNFPRLRNLEIRFCYELKEIPDCFGEMSTLELIEVDKSNPSHVAWANEVRETQRNEYGNESLQIRIHDDDL